MLTVYMHITNLLPYMELNASSDAQSGIWVLTHTICIYIRVQNSSQTKEISEEKHCVRVI